MADLDKDSVRVEISTATVSRLLVEGQVCAAEFRCLDCRSKQCLWRLCLQSCACKVDPKMESRPTHDCFFQPGGECQNDKIRGCR